MGKIERSVPALQVRDVGRSIDWYATVFGFEADPFPEMPPHSFAILRRNSAEIMLQRNEVAAGENTRSGWSVYLWMGGGQLLDLAEAALKHTELVREPERMFYGQVEFEVVDPDGHIICVAEQLPGDADVPRAREEPDPAASGGESVRS